FLPSYTELATMRYQLEILGDVGNFSGRYWSSTEIVSSDAKSIDFDSTSGTTTTDKGTYCKVRAARAFCNGADPATSLVVYLGNGNDDGEPPLDLDRYGSGSTVTVRNNSGVLQRTGYSFCGWNTAADGSGTDYAEGSTFSMGSTDIVLYAKWTDVSFRVDYLPNGASGGTVPFDSTNYAEGQTVTVLGNPGNLVKSGYDFNGWNTQADGNGTNYLEGSALTMGTADVRLYARWMSPYNVGDTGPAGGIVFFDKGDYSEGWRYLEAAPVDQSVEAEWGCMGTEIPGADSSLLGDGFQNTLDIEAGCAAPGTAAEICANYNYGGYDDWHLPSATELFVMMTEVYHTGGFTDGYYWSSTEDSADKAISVRYEEGVVCTEVYNFKDQLSRVRAVRAF
ncbi:MAG: InlB B-repeat-containing protein, partial [Spirochaetia bacterium]